MRVRFSAIVIGLLGAVLGVQPVLAHGPLFSPAPETIWKDGTEVTLGYHGERASGALGRPGPSHGSESTGDWRKCEGIVLAAHLRKWPEDDS